jgi:hypothetical protein
MSYAAILNYPNLRRLNKCPLCSRSKSIGLIMCRSCDRLHQLYKGEEDFERQLATLEYDAMAKAETNVFVGTDKFFRLWRTRPNSRVAYF